MGDMRSFAECVATNVRGDAALVQRRVNRLVRRRKKPCFFGATCSAVDGDCATTAGWWDDRSYFDLDDERAEDAGTSG